MYIEYALKPADNPTGECDTLVNILLSIFVFCDRSFSNFYFLSQEIIKIAVETPPSFPIFEDLSKRKDNFQFFFMFSQWDVS